MLENDNIINYTQEESDKEETNTELDEHTKFKVNNIFDKLSDIQKLVKKECILKKLCNYT